MHSAIQSLISCPWKSQILCFDTLDSTNNEAKRIAAQGAPAGTILIADRQTQGRGRLGRSFLSLPDMGVYLSVILRPDCPPAALMHLTCAVAAAMCGVLENAVGIRPGIKWINDLVLDGKKLAGILTELSINPRSGNVDYAVVGIGVNCNERTEDFPPELQDKATSLSAASSRQINRTAIAAAMIDGLWQLNEVLFSQRSEIMAAYRKDCVTIGKEIAVISPSQTRRGFALDVEDDGALLVEFSDGTREQVSSGEVSVRGVYGYV